MRALDAKGRAPTVVLFDGMDNCKEMSVLFAGLEFARRGMNTLAIDGRAGRGAAPSQDPRAHDYEVAGTAAYEFVRGGRTSMRSGSSSWATASGLLRTRIAAFERRYAPACAWVRCTGPARLAIEDQGAVEGRSEEERAIELPVPVDPRAK